MGGEPPKTPQPDIAPTNAGDAVDSHADSSADAYSVESEAQQNSHQSNGTDASQHSNSFEESYSAEDSVDTKDFDNISDDMQSEVDSAQYSQSDDMQSEVDSAQYSQSDEIASGVEVGKEPSYASENSVASVEDATPITTPLNEEDREQHDAHSFGRHQGSGISGSSLDGVDSFNDSGSGYASSFD